MKRKKLSIAHRGASGYYAENTIAAFEKAFELGCDGIELDVHLSADGEIIVIHDATIDRTTNGTGLVSDLTLEFIKSVGIPNAEIPTLDEVIAITPKKCLVNIELKSADTVQPVADLIAKCVSNNGWNYDSFLVSSFDWTALTELQKFIPEIPIGILTEDDLNLAVAYAECVGAHSIHPHFHLLTFENSLQIKRNGLKIFVWTVNHKSDFKLIKSFSIDAIITDFPNRK